MLQSPDRLDLRLFLNVGEPEPNAVKALSIPVEGDLGRLLTDEEARARGFDAGVQVPIRSANKTEGFLTLLARRPHTYGDETLQKARALADYVSTVLSHDDAVRRMSQELLSL